MKLKNTCLLSALLALATLPLSAGDDHAHASAPSATQHRTEAGPNGGRLITRIEPAVELLAKEGGRVEIRFLDESREVIPPEGQEVSLIGGSRSAPFRLSFERAGEVLVSKEVLPEAGRYPVILSIRKGKEGKVVRERFTMNFTVCPGCDLAEYACICGHED